MKPRYWIYLFLIVVVGYFTAMLLELRVLLLVSKPLILLSLLGYFLSSTKKYTGSLSVLMALALLFSAVGDSLLLFDQTDPRFFILGLLAFLTAHIFYIISFHRIIKKEALTVRWPAAVLVAIYYGWLIAILLPHLGPLKLPVVVYGIIISFMLFLAMQLYLLRDHRIGQFLLTGAVLFVASDSILAYTRFCRPIVLGGWLVMSSYILAQWLLVKGCCLYLINAVPPATNPDE
ncbi:hypothetical protein GCM10027051_19330 [Niabella terrae]